MITIETRKQGGDNRARKDGHTIASFYADNNLRSDSSSEEFIRQAMDEWGGTVYLMALSQTRSVADAQDVAQDVFIKLLTSDTAFSSKEHLKAWLLRVTINRCHELHRAPWNSRVEALDAIDTIASSLNGLPSQAPSTWITGSSDEVADEVLENLEANALWHAIGQLPKKLRTAVLLHYIENYSMNDIARILECSPTTVRTRLYRARRQLRALIEPETSSLDQEDDYA